MEGVFTPSNIVSVILVVAVPVITVWLKVLIGRSFSGLDKSVESLTSDTENLKEKLKIIEKQCYDLGHGIEDAKNLDAFRLEMRNLFLAKPDFTREISLVVNQIDSIHLKIEQIENRIEDIRDKLAKLR